MTQSKQIRTLIADDHFLVRLGLIQVINEQEDMTVVGEAANGHQAIELYRQHLPDVTLMDVRMPGLDGVEATISLCNEHKNARIIILTTYDGDQDIYRALQGGASAYLLKDQPRQVMLETIRNVHLGTYKLPKDLAERLAGRRMRDELTPREMEILKLIVKGLTNKEISNELSITEGTVKIHINSILSKLDVNDRTQAATTAIKRGIVKLSQL
jgi:two-component system, NarL family, response regulator